MHQLRSEPEQLVFFLRFSKVQGYKMSYVYKRRDYNMRLQLPHDKCHVKEIYLQFIDSNDNWEFPIII